tara:strand:- start:45 stop:443 length:399 start_codon:yes stop_codon:yes gene_type:complete
MLFPWFSRAAKTPRLPLLVLGAEFGSYQFLQLVQLSSKYQIAGFISPDHWQKQSGFGKIGVIAPSEVPSSCKTENIVAIVVTSDQQELFEESEDMQPVRDCRSLIKFCDILAIPQAASRDVADTFIDLLLQS